MKYLIPWVLACSLVAAQEPPPSDSRPPSSSAPAAAVRGAAASASQDPQPYDKVITKDTKSKKGLFTVHQVKDKYYYEIPKSQFNREFLWVTQIAQTTLGVGYGGQALGSRVVRWEQKNNRVNLRDVNYEVVADPKTPIYGAVSAANSNAIVMTFPIAAFGADGSAVIEISKLFTTDTFEFGARQRLNASSMDTSRSFIERISPYPENIEVEATQTYTKSATAPGSGGSTAPTTPFSAAGMRPGSASVVLHYSMVKLPEKPMQPRVFDERVGFFSVTQMDYGRDEQRAPRRRYILRWRLEKKNPSARLSEPVKPIVYYVDPATPTKWVPYVRAGVESWQKAFEAAGFEHAILARLAPTHEQDPDWSPEDARYSVIRWLPSTIENAVGPNIHDPRTGEILDADIQFYHNVMNLARSWYFVQAGPLDSRAQRLPLPDELMGRLIEFVVAHEVGHTLGFQHNMKASSMYPQEKIRDRDFVKEMGHTPSIMDYSRFNYVAQPEDNIDPDDLVPGVGPYDIWATTWGYKPIPNVTNPDQERDTLDQWAREQDEKPYYRFSTAGAAGSDPGELTEAVGDGDSLKSTALGIKNLQRVVKMLMPATTWKEGESFDDLGEMYGRMLAQWTLELNHVAALVGGFNTQEKYVGQQGVIFEPVARARQMEAVRFLNENAFATPAWAIDREILRRIEPIGAISRVHRAQTLVLNNLLSSQRFARLVEQEALDGSAAYAPPDFLSDVRRGIWKELDGPQVRIDAFRRELQRGFLDVANVKLNSASTARPANLSATSGDEKPLYRAELKALNAAIGVALPKAADRETKAHLEAARDTIARILDPRFAPPANSISAFSRGSAEDLAFFTAAPDELNTCWPDYIIRP